MANRLADSLRTKHRKIPERAIDKVAANIKEFGWRQAIVVDKDNVIIRGHTRLLAALILFIPSQRTSMRALSRAFGECFLAILRIIWAPEAMLGEMSESATTRPVTATSCELRQ